MDNCFEACRLAGVNRIAYASSLAVSGEQKFYGDRLINEGDFRHGHVQYAMHKIFTNGRCRTTAKSTAWRSRRSARPTSPDLTRLSARLTTSSALRHQHAETGQLPVPGRDALSDPRQRGGGNLRPRHREGKAGALDL